MYDSWSEWSQYLLKSDDRALSQSEGDINRIRLELLTFEQRCEFLLQVGGRHVFTDYLGGSPVENGDPFVGTSGGFTGRITALAPMSLYRCGHNMGSGHCRAAARIVT